jgi:hypothetical protein
MDRDVLQRRDFRIGDGPQVALIGRWFLNMVDHDVFRWDLCPDEFEAKGGKVQIGSGNTLIAQKGEIEAILRRQAGLVFYECTGSGDYQDKRRHGRLVEMQNRIVVRQDRNHPAVEGNRLCLIRNDIVRFGFDQVFSVGPVIRNHERVSVNLRRNAMNDQLAAVC